MWWHCTLNNFILGPVVWVHHCWLWTTRVNVALTDLLSPNAFFCLYFFNKVLWQNFIVLHRVHEQFPLCIFACEVAIWTIHKFQHCCSYYFCTTCLHMSFPWEYDGKLGNWGRKKLHVNKRIYSKDLLDNNVLFGCIGWRDQTHHGSMTKNHLQRLVGILKLCLACNHISL